MHLLSTTVSSAIYLRLPILILRIEKEDATHLDQSAQTARKLELTAFMMTFHLKGN